MASVPNATSEHDEVGIENRVPASSCDRNEAQHRAVDAMQNLGPAMDDYTQPGLEMSEEKCGSVSSSDGSSWVSLPQLHGPIVGSIESSDSDTETPANLGQAWEMLGEDDTSTGTTNFIEGQSDWVFETTEELEALFDLGTKRRQLEDRMEDSTITTHASDLTILTTHNSVKLAPRAGGPRSLLQHAGAPFAVGDVILADVEDLPLQRAFVMLADDPWYTIRLECGRTARVDASQGELKARYPVGMFAPDQDDPFKELRDIYKPHLGSYGVQLDSQKISLERIREEKSFAKAVKSDDAEVPVYLWNERIQDPSITTEQRDRALEIFRRFGYRWFMRGLRRDCSAFIESKHGSDWMTKPRAINAKLTSLGRDLKAMRNMLWHATHTNWFEYKAGSRLVHFRFPIKYRRVARDGVKCFFETPGPATRDSQPTIPDADRRGKVRSKLKKVLGRRYMLTTGLNIKSLIKFFDVEKGDSDIRIVYDATANKLNSCVWVPSFWLPTVESLVRVLNENSWMTDRDVGDMFLNFQLDEAVKPFTGVDLTSIYEPGEPVDPKWAYWDRNLMGFAASPHNSILMALVVEEVIRGNRHDNRIAADGKEMNPFQWDKIKLNMPGSTNYDPTQTWICKMRKDLMMACDMLTFVDDERVAGPTRELTWQASHRIAAIQAYLGIQDAARKVRPCSQTPGAWAGAVVHIFQQLGVCTLTSEEKWGKLKKLLKKWLDLLEAGETDLAHKELLSDRGFMVYVTRTYPAMIPYLKGFHLTIEMWRGGRDAEGWKLKDDQSVVSSKSIGSLDVTRSGAHGVDLDRSATYAPNECEDEDEAAMDHRLCAKIGEERVYAPTSGVTQAVPRLLEDIRALSKLADFELPPLRVVRPSMVVSVFYGFGDASGKEFGSTISDNYNCQGGLSDEVEDEAGLRYRVGVWTADERAESSNYKELCNLVESTELEAKRGRLRNCEFFLFTDNSTAESAFYRGTSSSKMLHSLVLRLRILEMKYGLLIHIIHVSGTRMIAQGTDGASRGSLMEGVLAGKDMLSFVDLAKTALERHPPLLAWIRSWTGMENLEPLTPEGWFEEGHGITGGELDSHKVWIPKHCPGNKLFLWAPQPAVADAVLEELLKSRHKRPDLFHVIVIPRLMTPRWRRLFNKACDFSFVVPANVSFWPAAMFEPIWVGIILPFTHHRPWSFKRAPLLVELGRDLRRMWPEREGDARDLLRKLLLLPRKIRGLSQRQACGVLHVPWTESVPNGNSDR